MKGIELFGECVAPIMNSILLSIVYFVAIGPTSILKRITASAPLSDSAEMTETFWHTFEQNDDPVSHYRQY